MFNYKTAIAPIIAVVAIVAQMIWKIEIPAGEQTELVNAITVIIASVLAVYGIVQNHRTDKKIDE